MKKKSIMIICSSLFLVLFVAFTAVILNPVESCACLPDYEDALIIAENATQRALEKAIIDGNLDYNAELFQFGPESMRLLSEELSAVSDVVNPNDIWLKVEDDMIVELLLKTERTLVYASIFTKKETVYLLVADSVPGWYEMSTAKPAGW